MRCQQRWVTDIATANNTVAHIQMHDLGNGSTGFMRFTGHPVLDELRMDSIIQIRLTIHEYVFVCAADMARDSSCRSERCLADYSAQSSPRITLCMS